MVGIVPAIVIDKVGLVDGFKGLGCSVVMDESVMMKRDNANENVYNKEKKKEYQMISDIYDGKPGPIEHACLGFPALNAQIPTFADTMRYCGYHGTSPVLVCCPTNDALGQFYPGWFLLAVDLVCMSR